MRNRGQWLGLVAIGVLCGATLTAQSAPAYRGFQLGANVDSIASRANVVNADVKTLHRRPALIQTFEWRPSYFMVGSSVVQSDPVRQIVFSFFDDQLYRIVVDYDRTKTEGMTGADIIAAVSASYGPPLLTTGVPTPTSPSRVAESELDAGALIAQWGDAEFTVALYQSPDFSRGASASAFRLIVASPRLSSLSRVAAAQATRLDDLEAPQRDLARQKKDLEDNRATADKARGINKPAFTP